MRSILSTPPAIVAGTLAAGPQPMLSAPGGLVLRPWKASDAAVFLGAYRDPEIRHWHTRRPESEAEVRAWFERYRQDWAQEAGAHWAVTRGGGEVLGRIAMGSMDLDDGVAGCAYWVLPAARGAGVATRALTALSVWALGEAGFHRLYLDHSTRNSASCRVAVKSGFLLEGTKRSDAVHSDGRHDMHLHARVRGDEPHLGKPDAAAGRAGYRPGVAHTYPPLNVEVRTPRLTLAGASDELLERLVPLVRAGVADAEPWPFDDPISFYADSPEREWQWLRGIWAGRGRVSPDAWRLYFAVLVDGEPVGMQDLIGTNFTRFGTVSSFSWLAPGRRGQGLGKEMRAAILQLAFAGLGAREAGSDAFVDNEASNGVSRGLGYEPNGTDWDTRRGEPARIQQWRLNRDAWERVRRDDIELIGVEECLPVLGIG